MKKYTNIAKTLGWEEVPESTDEGLFLQPEEAAAIDTALGKEVEDKTEEVNKLTGELATANQSLKDKETELTTATDRITALEAENKKLGGQSSGTGTTLATTEDEKVKEGGNGKISLNSADHPLNKYASSKINAKKKITK
jgi:chromosome segregation ATPase